MRAIRKSFPRMIFIWPVFAAVILCLAGCTTVTYSDYHDKSGEPRYDERNDSYHLMIQFPQTAELGHIGSRFDLHHASLQIWNRLDRPVDLIVNKFEIAGDGLQQSSALEVGSLRERNDQPQWSSDEATIIRLYSAEQVPKEAMIRFEAIIQGEKYHKEIKTIFTEQEDPTFWKPTKKFRFNGSDHYAFKTKDAEITIDFFAVGKPDLMKVRENDDEMALRFVIQMDARLQNRRWNRINYEILNFSLEGEGLRKIKGSEIGKSIRLQPDKKGYYRNYAFDHDRAYVIEKKHQKAVCTLDFVFNGEHIVRTIPLTHKQHRGWVLLD